jgi:hypothetical protein
MVGINDALRLTPVLAWRQNLQLLIEAISRDGTGSVQTLIVGIPPLDAFRTLAPLPRRIAARHAHQLNETTKCLCRGLTQVTFIPFCLSKGAAEPALCGNSKTYQAWARDLVVHLTTALQGTRINRHQVTPKAHDATPAVQPFRSAGPHISTISTLIYSTQQEKNDA